MVIGKDADDLGAALGLAVQSFDWNRTVPVGAMFLREGHVVSTSCATSSMKMSKLATLDWI